MGTERKEMAGEQEKIYEVVYDMSSGLVIAKVSINKVKEQDINARVMKDDMQDMLTANIKKRGQLESLPLLVLVGSTLEIISGHHRIKSARAAGLEEIIAIVDISGLSRSQIAAKQLAHNAISGFDDDNTLREICKMITDVDDMLESALPEEYFKNLEIEIERLATPSVEFDWKVVEFAFLPHQLKDLSLLTEKLSHADCIGVASIEQFKPFIDALEKTQKFEDVRSVGTAIHMMINATLNSLGEKGYGDDIETEWIPVSKLLGGGTVPKESAEIINKAIKKAEKDGTITSKNRWQLIEYLCANYLA